MTRARNVLVTAGGQSVGRVMAEKFLARGDRVHICDANGPLLESVLAANRGISGTVCDVGDEAQVDRLFEAVATSVGPLDVLVNTVGISGPRGPIETLSYADWRACMVVNLDSMFFTVRRAVPMMRQRGGGAIVNFSTGSTRTNFPLRTPYVASKAGVEGLTRALARELGPANISVNAILPGMIDNDRMRGIVARVARQEGRTNEDVEAEYLRFISMRSKIDPAEIAETVLFLASDPGRHISGQLLGVCGNIEWEP